MGKDSEKKSKRSKSKSKKKSRSSSKDRKSKKSKSKDKKDKKKSSSRRSSKSGKSKKSSKSRDSSKKKSKKDKSRKSSKDKDKKDKKAPEIVTIPPIGGGGGGMDLNGFGGPTMCIQYNEPLTLFCESCEEPICYKATILGPHNTQLHRIIPIMEAYRVRVAKMSQILNSSLLVKRDNLVAQIHRLDYRMEEIKFVRTIIERDARSEYGGIIERLKSTEGQKLAILQHEMAELQKDIDRINDINSQFGNLTKSEKEVVNFLLRSRVLSENVEYISAKPFKVQVDVTPYDLPRELKEKREKLKKFKIHQELLNFKDNIIWKLYQEKKEIEDKAVEELEHATNEEIKEWSGLVDKFATKLNDLQLVCFYCGVAMSQESCNEPCHKNNQRKLCEDFEGWTVEKPDNGYHGGNRHFFHKPDEELMNKLMYKDKTDKQVYQAPYHRFIEVKVQKLRQMISEDEVDLKSEFEQHDSDGTGKISPVQFKYILSEKCGFSKEDYENLANFLDPAGEDEINYKELLKLIKDKNYINSIPVRGMDFILNNQHR